MILLKFQNYQSSSKSKILFNDLIILYFRTWLLNNVEAARIRAKRNEELLSEISDKVNSIKDRFKFRSIEYSNDWSVSQFFICLRTLLLYADKWHERLLTLQGILILF